MLSRRQWDAVFVETCEHLGLRPADVRAKHRMQTVRLTHAIFRCKKCLVCWSTHRAWMMVDCKQRRIARAWIQECRQCSTPGHILSSKSDIVLRAFRLAALNCLERSDNISCSIRQGGAHDVNDQHHYRLCEKCQYGLIDCITGLALSDEDRSRDTRSSRVQGLQLPDQFRREGSTSWADYQHRIFRPTLNQREARARTFHAVKVALLGTQDLHIDVHYEQGVYESGSMKKGTQVPWSDIDVVLFVTDFRPDEGFCRRRLDLVVTCLQDAFQQRIQVTPAGVGGRMPRFSRSVKIRARDDDEPIKFDMLLGGKLDAPRDFIPLPRRHRQAWSASSAPFQVRFVVESLGFGSPPRRAPPRSVQVCESTLSDIVIRL